MKTKELAESLWNEIADEYNQWPELGADEKAVVEYFVQRLEKGACEWEVEIMMAYQRRKAQ